MPESDSSTSRTKLNWRKLLKKLFCVYHWAINFPKKNANFIFACRAFTIFFPCCSFCSNFFFRLTLGFRFMNISVLDHIFLFALGIILFSLSEIEFSAFSQNSHQQQQQLSACHQSCIKQFLVPLKLIRFRCDRSFSRKSSFFLRDSAKVWIDYEKKLIGSTLKGALCHEFINIFLFLAMLCPRNAFFYLFLVFPQALRILSLQCTSTPTELFTPKILSRTLRYAFCVSGHKSMDGSKPIYKARNTESH